MYDDKYLPELSETVFEKVCPPVEGLRIRHEFQDPGGIGYEVEVFAENVNEWRIGEPSPSEWGKLYLKVPDGADPVPMLTDAILKAVAEGESIYEKED